MALRTACSQKTLSVQPETRIQDAHSTFLNTASHNDNAHQSWVTACCFNSSPKTNISKNIAAKKYLTIVKGTSFPFNTCPFFLLKMLRAGSERSMKWQRKTNQNSSAYPATELDRDSNVNQAPDSLKTWGKKKWKQLKIQFDSPALYINQANGNLKRAGMVSVHDRGVICSLFPLKIKISLTRGKKKSQKISKLMALCIHLLRTIKNFCPVSCCQQTLADAWLLRLVLPLPLLKCEENPAVVIITMETCPVSTVLPWGSTSTPQMYIFHQHTAESCSLWANDVPSPLPSTQAHGRKALPHVLQTHRYWNARRCQGGQPHLKLKLSGWRVLAWGCPQEHVKNFLVLVLTEIVCGHRCFVRPTNLQRGQGKGEKPKNPQTEA